VQIFARDVDPTYGSDQKSKIAMFTKTFSLSPYTTFDNILRNTCIYWGVIKEDFSIYQIDDDTGEPKDLFDEPEKVIKFLELYAQTSKAASNDEDKA